MLQVRNILFKSFLLAILLLIISNLLYSFNSDFFFAMFEKYYFIKPEQAAEMVFFLYGIIKIIAVFLFLIPAIAIHMNEHCKCCREKQD
ncbi:MAG: hypothetical protein PHX18_05845 [Candidatus Gastranaerophilales bacterium]|nr:hypothetical protein [Candidatus Gastranaerophilales bacterium]